MKKLGPLDRDIHKIKPYRNITQDALFDEVALHVYTRSKDSLKSELNFQNYLLSEIQIIGYSTKPHGRLMILLDNPFSMDGFSNKAQSHNVKFNFVPNAIYYKTKITGDSIIRVKVSKWPPSPLISSLSKTAKELPTFSTPKSNKVVLKRGKYTFRNDVFIPRGKKLFIEAGTSINLLNGARFVFVFPCGNEWIKECSH